MLQVRKAKANMKPLQFVKRRVYRIHDTFVNIVKECVVSLVFLKQLASMLANF
jgi:transcription initiation factor IIF auxiliary subunit